MMACTLTQEQAFVLGKHENLVGIWRAGKDDATHVIDADRNTNPLTVLMLNAGMLHSAGPFRLHVDLARALGNANISSFRMDISGIGESLAVGTNGTSLERVAAEVSAAIDFLEQECSATRFALFGLCSGADDALYAAMQDERISGLFSVDGLGFRTTPFYWHRLRTHWWPKLCNPNKWKQGLGRLFKPREEWPASLQSGEDIREFPARRIAAQQLRSLAHRGVVMHFHYTGGVGNYYNYAKQFEDMFPELFPNQDIRQHITSSFQPESDHVGYLCEHRAALVRLATNRFVEFQQTNNFS